MERTKRVKISTGLKCNARCRFCYYQDHVTEPNPPTQAIKWRLRFARRHGAMDIDFSGGEPTIRPDLPELVAYAKKLGFRTICLITNGIRMSDKDYTLKLVEAGLNDVLFSIEGYNSEIHEYLTRVPNSFEKLIRAIYNVKELNVKFRTNTTVTRFNFPHLTELSELIVKLEPKAVNFILFNDWSNACNVASELACKYSEASPYLKKAIDILNPCIDKVTVRYIPFCFMVGYERFVCNFLQKKYDSDEWMERIKTRIESSSPVRYWFWVAKLMVHFKRVPNPFAFDVFLEDLIVDGMRSQYIKKEECKKCKYYTICDGIEKSYANILGLEEIKPVEGKVIDDPLFYIKSHLTT